MNKDFLVKSLFIILFILLSSIPAFPRNYVSISVATSFPVTCSDNDSIVFLDDVSSATGLLVFDGADNVWVNGQGYTATWDTDYGSGIKALYFANSPTGDTVSNLRVVSGGGYNGADTSFDCDVVNMVTALGILFEDCYFEANGHNAKCFHALEGYPRGIEFASDSLVNMSTSYTVRAYYDSGVMKFDDGSMDYLDPYEWHLNVHDCYLYGPHTGIASTHLVRLRIHKNKFACDAVNEYYPTYDGNSYHTSVNPYAVTLFRAYAGTVIDSNIIIAGDVREGCEGFLVECGQGTEDNPIRIFGNIMDIHNGPNLYIPAGQCGGIMNRGRGHFYVDIYDNDITITVDDDDGTSAIGVQGIGLRLEHGDENYECGSGWSSYNDDYGNRIRFITSGTTTTYPISFCNGGGSLNYDGGNSVGNVCYGNYVEGRTSLFSFGATFGAQNMNSWYGYAYACTLNAIDGVPEEVFRVGRWEGSPDSSYGNIAQDFVFEGDITDWHDILFVSGSGESSLEFWRTLSLYVIGVDSLPLRNALVSWTDNYGDTGSAYTDNNGWAHPVVRHWKELDNAADSTAFNPFQIVATYNTWADTIDEFNVSPTNFTDTLYMPFAGKGSRPDNLIEIFIHASVGHSAMTDVTAPYDGGFKHLLYTLVSNRIWPLSTQMYDFRSNTAHGAGWEGLKSAYAQEVYETPWNDPNFVQNGSILNQDFAFAGSPYWLAPVNWWETLEYYPLFWNETYNPRDTAHAWGKLMLPNIVVDHHAGAGDSLIDTVNYNIIEWKTSFFWQVSAATYYDDYKDYIQEFCDSAGRYESKIFVIMFGSPAKLGSAEDGGPTNNAATMSLSAWTRDTLVTPPNVFVFHYYDVLVDTNHTSERYGCCKEEYEGSDSHPNTLGSETLRASHLAFQDWLYDQLYYDYWPTTNPAHYLRRSRR